MNKIDSYYEANNDASNMKPIYGNDAELGCGTITYGDKFYLVDNRDKDKIINFSKKFVFISDEDYPSYACNYKRITYLDFIFNYSNVNVYYHFKNGNKFDLSKSNVEIYHQYHKTVAEKYEVIEYIRGHYSTTGQDANIMKNPLWRIIENDKEYLLMYCEKDTLCKLCPKSYQQIIEYEQNENKGLKTSWFKLQNGYIMTSNNLYIHHVITGCHGNVKGTKLISVDPNDQDKLNNTWENIRIASRKEQEENTNGIKRERKHNAKELPQGITQKMMKKYVVYYQEWLDKEHTKQREFFKVEKHPKLDKPWTTSKSSKVSIEDKLREANKVVDDLDKDVYPEKTGVQLPKYVSIQSSKGKQYLVFEKDKMIRG